MNRLTGRVLVAAGVLLVGLATGCGKKSVTEETAEPSASAAGQPLSESQAVMAALDKKDYPTVLAGLLKAKQSAASNEEKLAAAALIDDVKIRLIEQAPTDPKAAEALMAVRQMSGGR